MQTLTVTISNNLKVVGAPPTLLKRIKGELTFENPKYNEAIQFGRTTRGVPKIISLYKENKGIAFLPRGYWDALCLLANEQGYQIEVLDSTPSFSQEVFANSIVLRGYQNPFVADLLNYTTGLGVAAPGSGKTIMGIELYARLGVPCLWLTHTGRLAKQTREKAEELLGIETGIIGKGKEELAHFTVGMVQTLVNRDLSVYKDKFGLIIIDECFPAGTLVDGRPIESIKEGDYVLSFNEETGLVDKRRVVRLFKSRVKSLVRVVMSCGKAIVCTPGHPFWTRSGWKQASTLTLNDEVLNYDQETGPSTGLQSMRKYDRKENHSSPGRTRALLSHVQGKTEESTSKGSNFTVQRVWEDNQIRRENLKQSNRGETLLLQKLCPNLPESCLVRSDGQNKSEIRQRTDEKEQSDAQSRNAEETVEYASSHGAQTALAGRERKRDYKATRASVSSIGRELVDRTPNDYPTQPRPSKLHLHRYSPAREKDSYRSGWGHSWAQKSSGSRSKERKVSTWVGVDSVEVLKPGSDGRFGGLCPDGYVYNVEVEKNHTYLANNIVVHNCHHQPSVSFTEVVGALNARYIYGLTATPYRDDGLEALMFLCIGPERTKLERSHLRKLGYLMTPTIIKKPTGFNFPYSPGQRGFGYKELSTQLASDKNRNTAITSDVLIEATIDATNVCIILVSRISHGETLFEMLDSILPGVGLVHSKMGSKKSDQVLDSFEAGELRVLIATYRMLAEGFDYQPTNRLFLTAPFKGRALIEQACGRIERIFPGKMDAIVFDYVDNKISVLHRQACIREEIYKANDNPIMDFQ